MAITEELKQLVKQEADKLKEHATQEELARLDISTLDYVSDCVYNQLTGDFASKRASYLSVIACEIDVAGIINTPIESYITLTGAKNANLIAYLKGETEKLEL